MPRVCEWTREGSISKVPRYQSPNHCVLGQSHQGIGFPRIPHPETFPCPQLDLAISQGLSHPPGGRYLAPTPRCANLENPRFDLKAGLCRPLHPGGVQEIALRHTKSIQ